MAGKRTVDALVQRGISLRLAQALVGAGHTLAGLQLRSPDELQKLGMPSDAVAAIRDTSRPPIPFPTLDKLLQESNFQCCICKDPKNDVIVHHIVEWSDGGTHDEQNLVVLCLQHHSDAHSKKSLAQNLSAELLRSAKARWIGLVRRSNANAALRNPHAGFQEAIWDYFNHARLLDRVRAMGVRLESCSQFQPLLLRDEINEDGTPKRASAHPDRRRYIYDSGLVGTPRLLYDFYSGLLKRVLRESSWAHLEDRWNKRAVGALQPGELVVLRGLHYFKRSRSNPQHGPGQTVRAERRRKGIAVVFTIDAWEATSSSAHGGHLAGNQVVTSVAVVRSVSRDAGVLVVTATCLAVGTGFGNERPRPLLRFEFEEPEYDEDNDEEAEAAS